MLAIGSAACYNQCVQEPLGTFVYCPGCLKDPLTPGGDLHTPKFDNASDWLIHYYLKHWKTMPKAWGFTNTQRSER